MKAAKAIEPGMIPKKDKCKNAWLQASLLQNAAEQESQLATMI
jgi:hypothetical protein